jgi:hypothetical protein
MACNNTPTTTAVPASAQQGMADSSEVYAIIPIVKQEIDYVSVLKKKLICFTTSNGKKDSSVINTATLQSLANQFIDKDISYLKMYYAERIFSDQSTGSLTINYTAINDSVPVRSIDILLDENTRQVKQFFIKNFEQHQDTSIQEQYSWFIHRGFQINRSVSANNGYRLEERKEVKWGNQP